VKIVLDPTILARAHERSRGIARKLLINIVESEHRLALSDLRKMNIAVLDDVTLMHRLRSILAEKS
jgi:hypothetical protein